MGQTMHEAVTTPRMERVVMRGNLPRVPRIRLTTDTWQTVYFRGGWLHHPNSVGFSNNLCLTCWNDYYHWMCFRIWYFAILHNSIIILVFQCSMQTAWRGAYKCMKLFFFLFRHFCVLKTALATDSTANTWVGHRYNYKERVLDSLLGDGYIQ